MGRIVTFLGEVRAELSKVSWPTPQQTINLTLVVLAVSLIVGIYVGAIDLLMAKITEALLR